MSVVPHTRTHAVNRTLREETGEMDPINHRELRRIRHPVEIKKTNDRKDGFVEGIYDLDDLVEWKRANGGQLTDPLTRRIIDYDDVDAVRWEGDERHSDYVR